MPPKNTQPRLYIGLNRGPIPFSVQFLSLCIRKPVKPRQTETIRRGALNQPFQSAVPTVPSRSMFTYFHAWPQQKDHPGAIFFLAETAAAAAVISIKENLITFLIILDHEQSD